MLEFSMRDQWLWSFALLLIREYDFQMVHAKNAEDGDPFQISSGEGSTVLLLRNHGRKYEMIRLHGSDYAWPSRIARDIRQFADQVPILRKRLKASFVDAYQFFLFSYPDDERLDSVFEEMEVIEERKSKLTTKPLFIIQHPYTQNTDIQGFDLSSLNVDEERLLKDINETIQTKTLHEIKEEVKEEQQKHEAELQQVFQYGKPYFTFSFLLINLLVFGFIEGVGSSTDPRTLIEYGAKWPPAIVQGEYWRFITPMFLHIGFVHLLFNSMALFFLGSAVERIFGSFRFLWIYLFAGGMGTVASFAFTPHLAAGASGAIFGCFGALLYFGLKHRNLFFRTIGTDIIFILILNLGIGFMVPMIDNYGHIGGLVGGFIAAMMASLPRQPVYRERWISILVAVLGTGGLLAVGFSQAADDPTYHFAQAEMAIEGEEWEQAQFHLEEAIRRDPQLMEAYYNLALIHVEMGESEQALNILDQAMQAGIEDPLLVDLKQQIEQNEEGRRTNGWGNDITGRVESLFE